MIRVSRPQFTVLLDVLKEAPEFHYTIRQFDLARQLSIFLYRLGCYGDGSNLVKIAALLGIGDGGTIDRITKRMFQAFLSLSQVYIAWPSPEERRKIVEVTGEELPHCIGYMDGTEFRLAEAPYLDHSSYFSRKMQYAIKAQAVCDHQLRVRHLLVGYPGSAHDARMFKRSDIHENPDQYFSNMQWLAADSAYSLTDRIITPFRRNSTYRTAAERDTFNKKFCSYRVRIERCFGILKEKFASLKELRTLIKDQKSHKWVCDWITACIIIQNILLPHYEDDDFIYEPEDDEEEDAQDAQDQVTGISKREALFSLLVD